VTINDTFARRLRLRRLRQHTDDRLLVVPLDHQVSDGPVLPGPLDGLVEQVAAGGADAVVLHKGAVRQVSDRWFANMSVIVHLSASTAHAQDPDAKYLVASVEDALRTGADAVSVHVNLGSRAEAAQIRDLAAVAEACDRWNMALLAMVYPRGPAIENPHDPALVAHAAMLAAELGADFVKTVYAGSVADMRDVVRASPVPVLVAGGPPLATSAAVVAHVEDVMRSGAAGVAMGRNVFRAADPGAMVALVSAAVHQSSRPRRAAAPADGSRGGPHDLVRFAVR
jgi:2-amino-4,5-dihydroxy-6-oxo-7-(phosphonooxy)heptanoate synthase